MAQIFRLPTVVRVHSVVVSRTGRRHETVSKSIWNNQVRKKLNHHPVLFCFSIYLPSMSPKNQRRGELGILKDGTLLEEYGDLEYPTLLDTGMNTASVLSCVP